jgi:hypothetical protein
MHRILMYFFIMIASFACFFLLNPGSHAETVSKAILAVRASENAEMETQLMITNNKVIEHIGRKSIRKAVQSIPVSNTYLTLISDSRTSTFVADWKGNLFDEKNGEMLVISEGDKTELVKYMELLHRRHFGKMLEWTKVSKVIPRKAKCKVIDMETGLSFHVQRRAGGRHADVQPLTKEDTAIMKQIYNGSWSWKRKAILVQTGDQLLAASMHGMPHGGDGIPYNDFAGHFCIHFLGSTTHGSGNVDPEHQLMVRKAAGKLDEFFVGASPYEVADSFISALNLKERHIMKMCFTHAKHPLLEHFLDNADKIMGIRITANTAESDPSNLMYLDIPLEVSIWREGQREEKITFSFQMRRVSEVGPWKIDFIEVAS